jgi:uncharacterized protein (TIGR03000 family)
MYSVVLAAMLTAGPAAAPAWHSCTGCCGGYNAFSSSCCCGGYSCCGGYTSCCGGYVASYGCCGGYTPCCGGHVVSYGYAYSCCGGYHGCCGGWYTYSPFSSCCCGGWYTGYSSCCGGYGCCCGGWYPAYSGCCCGGVIAAPPMPKTPDAPKDKSGATGPAPATVIVKAPLDVHITANGLATERKSAEQAFITPNLDPDHSYSYTFQAEAVRDGKTVTSTKQVIVKAGVEAKVDFTDLAGAEGPAHITIKAPADARLTIDGVEVPGGTRAFNTPALPAGRTFYYTVKMESTHDGRAVSDSQRVLVEAGKDVSVEFKEPVLATAGK